MDKFQARYLEHQKRKSESLLNDFGDTPDSFNDYELLSFFNVLKSRRSQRVFNDKTISDFHMDKIKQAVLFSPSSCNRQAVYLKEVEPKEAEKYLVGGKNWCNKAKKTYLLLANKDAYKSPNEQTTMPYLDAGIVAQSVYLMCEVLKLGVCFVNPNIRKENIEEFTEKYNENNDYFCGVIVLGFYDKKAPQPPLRDMNEIILKD